LYVIALFFSDKLSYGLFVPSGALWGAQDIRKMAQNGSLKGLSVTMKKHPSAFRVAECLDKIVKANWETPGETVLYDGPLRPLCALAPNNVNTMACAALASGTALGFDRVHARLVSDPSLEAHVVEIDVMGPDSAGASTTAAAADGVAAKEGGECCSCCLVCSWFGDRRVPMFELVTACTRIQHNPLCMYILTWLQQP
jgi:predicted dinucleotide-utilizing enzyme